MEYIRITVIKIIIIMSLIQPKFALATNSLLRVGIKQQCFQSVSEGQQQYEWINCGLYNLSSIHN